MKEPDPPAPFDRRPIRDCYFQLPKADRIFLLVSVARARPACFASALKGRHIAVPRPGNAGDWLAGRTFQRVEKALDRKDAPGALAQVVSCFFRYTSPPVFKTFLDVLVDMSQRSTEDDGRTLAQAIDQIRRDYHDDSFLPLFEAWVAEEFSAGARLGSDATESPSGGVP